MVGGLAHINGFDCIDLFLRWFVKFRRNINGLYDWVDGSIQYIFLSNNTMVRISRLRCEVFFKERLWCEVDK